MTRVSVQMADSSLRVLSFCGREGTGAVFFGFVFFGATCGVGAFAGDEAAAGGNAGAGAGGCAGVGRVPHAERKSRANAGRGKAFMA